MNKITAFIKKHPMETGIFALIGGIIFILLLRGRSSSSTAQSGPGQVAALTLQEQQLQAASQLQQSQIASQTQAQVIAANAQNNQVKAALSAQNFQTEAQLVATLGSNAQNLQGLTIATNAQNYTNGLQAGLLNNYLQIQSNLATQAQNNQYNLTSAALSNVKNINGSQNRLALLLSAMNNIPGSLVAAQGQTYSSISGDNFLSNIFKSSSNILTSLLG